MSAFVTAIVSSWFLLENGGGTSSTLVGFFEKKENDIKIESTTGGNNYEDGVAYINTALKPELPTVNGLQPTPLFIALGHEMAHGMDPQKRAFGVWFNNNTPNYKDDDVSWSEIFTSHIENKIRAEWGISLRSSYLKNPSNVGKMGQLDDVTVLIDKKGNSLWYDKNDKMFNQMTRGDKADAYQSFLPNSKNPPLLNRYNYYEKTPQPNFLRLFLLYHSVYK